MFSFSVGVDLTGHTSKAVKPFLGDMWHYVVTVCDSANEQCPIFPFPAKRLHWSFADPSQATGTEEERLQTFRRVRDEIIAHMQAWAVEV